MRKQVIISRKGSIPMTNPLSKHVKSILLIIFAFCLASALIQGIPVLSRLPRDVIWHGCLLLFSAVPFSLFFLHRAGKLTEEKIIYAIIFSGMLFHSCYVLLSGLYDRQHDEGVYTGIATSQINPGHIGYIEYIYKFRRLPDLNPYQLFSYYHPPLHYALSGLWLIFLTGIGMPEDLAFENLQILPLLYSGLLMLLTFLILRKLGAHGKPFYTGLLLVAFHPALTIMSGSINNDMLSTLLLACCIYASLCWIRQKTLKNLIFIALSIGFGMLCKINTAVIAFPVGLIFLLDFIRTIRSEKRRDILLSIRNYALFAFVAGSTGLSWIIRNLIRFHVKPGISSATEASVMYTGNYGIWARIGLPAFADWHFSFPFHPLSGDAIHNTWVIMFQTSLFTEVYPQELSGLPLMLCQAVYPLAIIAALCSAVLFLVSQCRKYISAKKQRRHSAACEALFLASGYLAVLLSFVVFSLKYPYTCSSDFRYIVICLVYISIGLAGSSSTDTGRAVRSSNPGSPSCEKQASIFRRATCLLIWITLFLTTVIYMTWNQW